MAFLSHPVVNSIGAVKALGAHPTKSLIIGDLKYILVHRNTVGRTGVELAKWFYAHPEWTGGFTPYHFFLHQNGTVEQMVEISRRVPGARGANPYSIQIACDGDFRTEMPQPAQVRSLINLCAVLKHWRPDLRIEGHTDRSGRSSDPNKKCPGAHLDLHAIRRSAERRRELDTSLALLDEGIVVRSGGLIG